MIDCHLTASAAEIYKLWRVIVLVSLSEPSSDVAAQFAELNYLNKVVSKILRHCKPNLVIFLLFIFPSPSRTLESIYRPIELKSDQNADKHTARMKFYSF